MPAMNTVGFARTPENAKSAELAEVQHSFRNAVRFGIELFASSKGDRLMRLVLRFDVKSMLITLRTVHGARRLVGWRLP